MSLRKIQKKYIDRVWLKTLILEVCVPECHFPGTGFFPKNPGNIPSRTLETSHFPSRLIPTHSRLMNTTFSRLCIFYRLIAYFYTTIVNHLANSTAAVWRTEQMRGAKSIKAMTRSQKSSCKLLGEVKTETQTRAQCDITSMQLNQLVEL